MRFMRDINDNYGNIAGKIWRILTVYGPLDEQNLIEKSRVTKNDFYAGIGWLARENKVYKTRTTYQLGTTNLTDEIGINAGKVWDALNTTQDIDISTIAKISQIKPKDAYSALGWLAREDKLKSSTRNNQIKFKLK